MRAASAAVALLAMLVAAPAALAAPRVSIVDLAGEAAAHRNSAVGSAAKEYTASVKGADAAGATYRWSSSDPGAVSVTGSGAAVSVEPVSEGVATVSVRVRLADGAELSDSLLFGAWTRLGYRAAGALTSDAPLTRGALADEDAAFVRCTGRAGQGLAVVGRLGAFWRVELPEGFDYGDGSPNMASFAPASAVSIPATSLRIEPAGPLRVRRGEELGLSAVVEPAVATDAVVWASSDPKVAAVSGDGAVSGVAPGTAKVLASCGELEASAKAKVLESESSSGDMVDEGPRQTAQGTWPKVKSRGSTWVKLKWSGVEGASAYRVQLYAKGSTARSRARRRTSARMLSSRPG